MYMVDQEVHTVGMFTLDFFIALVVCVSSPTHDSQAVHILFVL